MGTDVFDFFDEPKPDKQYILKKIEIEYKTFGPFKDQYVGKIKFENGESEEFSFKLTPDMAEKHLAIMRDQIVAAAEMLSKDLLNTLPLK